MHNHLRIWRYCLAVLAIAISATTVNSQPLIAPANADLTYLSGTGLPVWMNNAVFENDNGTLYGVTWDDGAGNLYVYLRDDVGNTLGIALAGPGAGTMHHPDMVLGGDHSHNFLAAVYNADDGFGNVDVYLEIYEITGVGSGLGSTACNPNVYNISNDGTARDAHIDLANEIVTSGIQGDIFAIGWEDQACTYTAGRYGAMACAGSIKDVITNCGIGNVTYAPACLNNNATNDGEEVDVAIRKNTTTGYRITSTFFDDPNTTELYMGVWNIGNNPSQLAFNNFGTAGYCQYPRLDVQDNSSPVTTAPQIVYRFYDGANWAVQSVNSVAISTITNNLTATYTDPNGNPVVTAAPDDKAFAVAHSNVTNNLIVSEDVVISNGLLSTIVNNPNDDYFGVNSNTNGSPIDEPVAISNSYMISGTTLIVGTEFVCWYNSGADEIDCKTTTAWTPVFKATGLKNKTKEINVGIYPNPARDVLQFRTKNSEDLVYVISDITGHEVLQGTVHAGHGQVDISRLARGMYLVKTADKSGQALCIGRFTKE